MNWNRQEGSKDPPVKLGDSIESRCVAHPESHGQNYREHLLKDHSSEHKLIEA